MPDGKDRSLRQLLHEFGAFTKFVFDTEPVGAAEDCDLLILKACSLKPRRMLDKQPHRIRTLANQPQRLVDDVEVIQRIVIANHRAQMRAIPPDHPIALPRLTHEGFRKQATTSIGPVEQIPAAISLPGCNVPDHE